ncbi:hypothetical protein ACPEER_11625 [Pasteurella sp. PK-2025]|uniref:hypothetical protein n=1 Tax=Pasteurella sp. PK-2025 TaxID=3413133 RepID=UPI003C72BB76
MIDIHNLIIQSMDTLNKLKPSLVSESLSYRVDIIISILSKIDSSEENWSKRCLYLYPKYKNDFIKRLNEINSINHVNIEGNEHEYILEGIYTICAYFLREYVLYLESNESYKYRFGIDEMNLIHQKILKDDYPFLDDRNKDRLNCLKDKQLDIWILGYYLYRKSFKSFERYAELVDESKKNSEYIQNEISSKKESLNKFINEKEDTVRRLANILEEQKTAFNFVGLSKGFENLLVKKFTARNWTFGFLIVISIALLATPIVYICSFLNNPEIIKNPELWKPLLPFIGLEIIFLYFFRVILNHYNSIQTQIMQLELRQSLCQFIQSYADYAKEIKEKDDISLEKFENIIFSNILSDGNKVPGTFDGIETLANLIKEIRGGK